MAKKCAVLFAMVAALFGFLGVGVSAAASPAPLGGGSGIIVGDEALCTLTAIGRDSADRLVGITAGHCGEPGYSIVPEHRQDAGTVGRIVGKNRSLDYAVIEFDPAKVAPVNRVGNVTITTVGAPAAFPDVVCKQGLRTGNTCGVVWGDLLASNETWTQMCVIEGDSGSPVVRGTTLVGMVNAYVGVACLGPELGTDIDAVLADLNAHGGVGAGFRPI
ncbi:S1 family peptidase [Rhodococcus sp. NPDC058505]|uniref:S1 family peptidase n=1 Tax=unclassified Rhodococcus (in: high G+C Gram-positive bacteria) TaxID=192944 RepID=UPI0036614B34